MTLPDYWNLHTAGPVQVGNTRSSLLLDCEKKRLHTIRGSEIIGTVHNNLMISMFAHGDNYCLPSEFYANRPAITDSEFLIL